MSRTEHYSFVVERDDDGRVTGLEVDADDLDGVHRTVRLDGQRATQVVGALQDVLRAAGVHGQQWTAAAPVTLDEIHGAHAELLLRAVQPLRRLDRVTAIAEGIARMSREEATYWHAKTQRPRGLRALRVLLDGGVLR
jgi:hypothetical protein